MVAKFSLKTQSLVTEIKVVKKLRKSSNVPKLIAYDILILENFEE